MKLDGRMFDTAAASVTAMKAALNLGEADIASLAADLALKAPLASPTFTGAPSFPTGAIATTQTPGNNTTALATTAYADAIAALKAPLASPTFIGTPTLPTGSIATTQAALNNSTAVATTSYTDTAAALKLAKASNLSDLASFATSRANLGVAPDGVIFGLGVSTAGSSSTFGVAAGVAADSTASTVMRLSSAYTKTTAAWALGTAVGSLDTGAIANSTWYHVYLIKRTDTGVVDLLTSLSATAPTLPTNYTLFRRIGSMKTSGSAQWVAFIQDNDSFSWNVPIVDVVVVNPGNVAVTRTISTPLGVRVQATCLVAMQISAASPSDWPGGIWLSDLSLTDTLPDYGNVFSVEYYGGANTGTIQFGGPANPMTNTSSQIRSRVEISTANQTFKIITMGWVDTRGRFT